MVDENKKFTSVDLENNETNAEENTQNNVDNDKTLQKNFDPENFFNNLKNDTASFDKKDIANGKLMSFLSYIYVLALIPFFIEKNNKYVVYHAKQGMNLLIIQLIASVVISLLYSLLGADSYITAIITALISLALLSCSFIGIIYVQKDQAKELPFINKIKFIK